MNAQWKKGVLELCVLALCARKDQYGYELAHAISGQIEIAEGTIYPLLRRMTADGHFTTYIVESPEGPPRKYYRLSDQGARHFQSLLSDWRKLSAGIEQLISEAIGHDKEGFHPQS